jgi:hypothetical protein
MFNIHFISRNDWGEFEWSKSHHKIKKLEKAVLYAKYLGKNSYISDENNQILWVNNPEFIGVVPNDNIY